MIINDSAGALQISATTAAQFPIGRIIALYMTGCTVSVVPVYLSECSPPELRGLVGQQLQFQITFSVMIASFVNLGASHIKSPMQWKSTLGELWTRPKISSLKTELTTCS